MTGEQYETMINSRLIMLRAKMMGFSQVTLAKAMGIAQPTLSQKLNHRRPMTLEEAERLATLLKIEDAMFGVYFFKRKR